MWTNLYDWCIAPFVDDIQLRKALLASLLVMLTSSIVGTWVVLRGMSFLGDALAHGILPGAAVAYVVGFNTNWGAVIAALLMVGGINSVRALSPLSDDASIGILFVGFLAMGVIIISGGTDGHIHIEELDKLLFGSISDINWGNIRIQAIIAAAALGIIILFYRALLVSTFDETQAKILKLRPRLTHAVLVVLLAVTIIASFKVVGNLLVLAFLIAPPATAILLVKRVPWIMVTAAGVGTIAIVSGLILSYHHKTATGATMAAMTVVLFLVVLFSQALIRQIYKKVLTLL